MSAIKLNIRQRKALRPFISYTWKAEYSAATHKFYLDGDSTMRWKQDAPTNKFLIDKGLIEKCHSWWWQSDLGRSYFCRNCHDGKKYTNHDAETAVNCERCDGIGVTELPYVAHIEGDATP